MKSKELGQEFSVVNLLVPLAMLVGAVFGYRFGHHSGFGWSIAGLFAGALLSIPVLGVCMAAVVGICFLFEKIRR